jgi:hypothetical protein
MSRKYDRYALSPDDSRLTMERGVYSLPYGGYSN